VVGQGAVGYTWGNANRLTAITQRRVVNFYFDD
jgi:hypothetical protein